jgi:hypothetical protein
MTSMNTTSPLASGPSPRPGLNGASKRRILRWLHLVLTIPLLGYVYGRPAEVAQYAAAVRFAFVPIIMLSGFWMYSGACFAAAAVAVWLGAFCAWGSGAAILCEAGFIAAWKAGAVVWARRLG